MGFKCGIVGLPNVGKSTLFNALTQTAAAQAANYPFCTIEPNVGDVAVPDPRLATLAEIASSKEIIPTRLSFVDIAGLVRGASKGEGLGNQFLANIRECDAIAHVVRCFDDGDVTHVEGRVDPLSDIATIETELMLADLESLERRIVQMEKKAKGGDKEAKELLALAERSLGELKEGRPARAIGVGREERRLFQSLGLLSSKPVLYVCNVEEESADRGNAYSDLVKEQAAKEGAVVGRRVSENRERNRPLAAGRTRGLPRGDRVERARSQPRHSRWLRAFAPRHLLHRGAKGSARVDDRARDQGPAGGRRHPHRFRKGLYPRRNHRL